MKIQVILDPDENPEDCDEFLEKALSVKNSIDHKELYADSVANLLLDETNSEVQRLMKQMFHEIGQVLSDDIYQ